jgi:hypothetical protein
MKGIILRKATVFALLTILFFQFHSVEAQDSALKSIQKSTFSVEIDPVVPVVLHGFSGHFMWKPKNQSIWFTALP